RHLLCHIRSVPPKGWGGPGTPRAPVSVNVSRTRGRRVQPFEQGVGHGQGKECHGPGVCQDRRAQLLASRPLCRSVLPLSVASRPSQVPGLSISPQGGWLRGVRVVKEPPSLRTKIL